jgi:hypothetical protein
MAKVSTRRDFAELSLAAGIGMTTAFAAGAQASPGGNATELRSEFLFNLSLTTLPPSQISSDRVVVAVSSGTFDGPRLKGSVIGPAGDWMVQRRDESRLLDVRALLETDDGQQIYTTWRGIAYKPPDGALFARILPMFETGAARYAWLNNVVAVGVYQPAAGRIAYRVYQIL